MPPLFGIAKRHRLLVAAILLVATIFYFSLGSENDNVQRPSRPQGPDRISGLGSSDWDDDDLVEDELSTPVRGGLGKWLPGFSVEGKGRSILVTGGAGQLGHVLIPRLIDEGYTVHAMDIAPRPDTLPAKVVYHRANVESGVGRVLELNNFNGIVHLAAVSLEDWCAPKVDECERVNVGGTQAVMNAVEQRYNNAQKQSKGLLGFGHKDERVPWVFFASSMDVFGNADDTTNIDESSAQNANTILGRTKATAESVVRDVFERARRTHMAEDSAHPINPDVQLHVAIVRFADVYGYRRSQAIPSAFLPRLIQNAVTSLPIQFSSDRPPMDLLHIEDAAEGMLRIVQLQDGIAARGREAQPSLATFNLVHGGKRWYEEELIDVVRGATQSLSPVRDIGDHKSQLQGWAEYTHKAATRELKWEPTVSLPVGLSKTVIMLAQDAAGYARGYLHNHCPNDPVALDLGIPQPQPLLAENQRNRDLWKLEGCTVNMGFENHGFLHHLKCLDGETCGVDNKKVASWNWNQTVWNIEAVPGAAPRASGRTRVRFAQENGEGYLGFALKEKKVGSKVHLQMYKETDTRPHQDVFEVQVAPDSSQLRMLIPDENLQLVSTADSEDETGFELAATRSPAEYNMRLAMICCPSEGDWPLLLDDHESSDAVFGTTGDIPFNASRRGYLCERAHDAYEYYNNIVHKFQDMAKQIKGGDSLPHGFQPAKLSEWPDDWANKQLPPCWNDCASPTVCMQTGKCRCVQADSCARRRENPLIAISRGTRTTEKENHSPLGEYAGYSTILPQMVAKVDWRDLLYPEARAYLAAHPDFIKVHVVDGYPGQEEIESKDCHKLQSSHCFSADSMLYKAMRQLAVPANEADLIVLPVYQHCQDADFILHDVWRYATETIKGMDDGTRHTALVMTHDWGICLAFEWEMWSSRVKSDNGKPKLYPDPLLKNTLVFSVMGDWDSNCYRPAQDVVIPARTCNSIKLAAEFPDVSDIRPARERPRLVSWSGTFWGTGKNERLRLRCDRGGVGHEPLLEGQGPQSEFPLSWDNYMEMLNSARFCPQPRGVAGWSPRVIDAIYAGCIPVLISEASHYPFPSMLDWSQLAVRVHPTELDRVEEILGAIPIERVQQLQANIVAIRDAFLYPADDSAAEELERRGPMFFALHEAGMRLRTKYATK